MAKVIAICGRIASGKSWYAREMKESEPAVILSTDEVTWDLFDNEQGEGYDRLAARVNAYLMKKAAEIAQAGATVILDWGFWRRVQRAETTAYFRARGVPIEWHYVDVSEADWARNIAERNARIAAGEGGSDFYVDEGLKQKLLSFWETPDREEIDVWVDFRRR